MGTLIRLKRSVGENYAAVGRQLGLELDPAALDRAFLAAWRSMPSRAAIDGPRENDDKPWWRTLVLQILGGVAPGMNDARRESFFELAYEHFARGAVWELEDGAADVLQQLRPRYRLAVISNFDGRLRVILNELGIATCFEQIFLSSELGADKPEPEIFQRAAARLGLSPEKMLHVGDDPERDWLAAERAGMQVFRLRPPEVRLRDLLALR